MAHESRKAAQTLLIRAKGLCSSPTCLHIHRQEQGLVTRLGRTDRQARHNKTQNGRGDSRCGCTRPYHAAREEERAVISHGIFKEGSDPDGVPLPVPLVSGSARMPNKLWARLAAGRATSGRQERQERREEHRRERESHEPIRRGVRGLEGVEA